MLPMLLDSLYVASSNLYADVIDVSDLTTLASSSLCFAEITLLLPCFVCYRLFR